MRQRFERIGNYFSSQLLRRNVAKWSRFDLFYLIPVGVKVTEPRADNLLRHEQLQVTSQVQ